MQPILTQASVGSNQHGTYLTVTEQTKEKSLRSKIKILSPSIYSTQLSEAVLLISCRRALCLMPISPVDSSRVSTTKSWLGRDQTYWAMFCVQFPLRSSNSNEMQKIRPIHLKHENTRNHTIQRKLVRGGFSNNERLIVQAANQSLQARAATSPNVWSQCSIRAVSVSDNGAATVLLLLVN